MAKKMTKTQAILSDIKLKIKTGQWHVDFLMPTQRELAVHYQVNRSTIVEVMDCLRADGLIETRGRLGTFVVNQSWSLLASDQPRHWGQHIDYGFHQANQPVIQTINQLEFDDSYIRLGTGELAPSLYPKAQMMDILQTVGAETTHLGYESPKGSLALREAVSAYVARHGIHVSAESILIVSGSLQALQLMSIGLMSSSALLFTESPSYAKSLNTFQSVGIELAGIPMDNEGLKIDALLKALPDPGQRENYLYTIPTFHNPTGRLMSEKRRLEVLDFCLRYKLPIIEDDAYRELWLDTPPPPPLKANDAHGNVLYLGTVSKSLAAGLRIGWLIGPEPVVDRLGDIKMQLDYGASSISQNIVAKWLSSGAYDAYLETLRDELRQRRSLMLSLLETHFRDLADWETPTGSFYVWLKLRKNLPMTQLFKKALGAKLLINPGDIYDFEKNNHLRLSYAYASHDELRWGIEALAGVIKEA